MNIGFEAIMKKETIKDLQELEEQFEVLEK